jgi:F1F0 ATPase subunit 2
MTMGEALGLVVAFFAGIALAALFFGGLWWTVRRAVASKRPEAWFFGGPILRMGLALTGFYLVSQGDWRRLLGCLLGFVAGRILVIRRVRAQSDQREPIILGGRR